MRYISKHYRILSLTDLLRELETPTSFEPALAVTFDDGYRDLYRNAFPVLVSYRVPATVYLISDAVEKGLVSWYDRIFVAVQVFPSDILEIQLDQPRRYFLGTPEERLEIGSQIVRLLRTMPDARRRQCCAEIERHVKMPEDALQNRMLNWEQVWKMQRAGISFGVHTMSHPVVSRLEPVQYTDELLEARKVLEGRLQTKVEDFAFPFGQKADCGEIGASLKEWGYRSAATTLEGVNRSDTDRFALRRTQVCEERSLAMFAWKLTRLLLQSEAQPSSAERSDDRIIGGAVSAADEVV